MNLARLLEGTARRIGDAPAITIGGDTWSYAELRARVQRLAGYMRARLPDAQGARVAIAMDNSPEYLLVMFAAWQAGFAIVPMNAKLHAREFAWIMENSGARMCFASPRIHAELKPETAHLEGLILIETAQGAIDKLDGKPIDVPVEVGIDDPAWLFYTSGTTGRPKGATLTNRNMLFMTNCYFADIDHLAGEDTLLHAAPMSHSSGLYALPHIARGSLNVIAQSASFSVDEVIEILGRHRNVTAFAAPTMIVRLLQSASALRDKASNIRTLLYGGGPMYVADLERALDTMGPRLLQLYGQGESPNTITCLSKPAHAEARAQGDVARYGSCGVARTGVEVRVVDPEGNDVKPGETGEVITRSDCVMRGYWNNPEATKNSIRDGWLWTGDLGAMDDQGYLTLKDRSKDLIISGGSNVYPREVEEVLLRHPGVAQAAVIGRPHAEWGEEVVAYVVAKPDAAVEQAVLDKLCLDNIARYKRPREYVMVSDLPKNHYGKVLKTELRARLTGKDTPK